jgi:hypothetical protein
MTPEELQAELESGESMFNEPGDRYTTPPTPEEQQRFSNAAELKRLENSVGGLRFQQDSEVFPLQHYERGYGGGGLSAPGEKTLAAQMANQAVNDRARQQMAVDAIKGAASYWDTLAMQTGNPRHIAAAQAAKSQLNQYEQNQAQQAYYNYMASAAGGKQAMSQASQVLSQMLADPNLDENSREGLLRMAAVLGMGMGQT